MERDAKRKATGPPSYETDSPRGTKRQKLPGDIAQSEETAETTTEIGQRFLDSLKNAKDKTGRPIITEFLTLPDKDTPGYYQEIRLPLSMDMIEAKLLDFGYPNLSALESDVKRMVANAKHFNEKSSAIYEDAERVRKTASNFMTKHNPAYRNPSYVAVATPIPDEEDSNSAIPPPLSATSRRPSQQARNSTSGAERSSRSSLAPRRKSESAAPSVAENGVSTDNVRKTFQQAQEQLIDELIHYTEDDLEIFTPFQNLPSRTLVDYYQVIKHPVSLRSVQKKVRGIQGRSAPTGITEFQTWDSFEEEVGYIWNNCRIYNEDGSDMFNLAGDLEDIFKEKLAAIKKVVEQPPQTTLKLKMSASSAVPSIKLKFGGTKDSPGSTPGPATPAPDRSTPGVIVHNDALERQQQMIAAGMNNGHTPATNGTSQRNPFQGSSSTPVQPLSSHYSRSGSAISPPRQTNGVKNESPALGTVNPVQAHRQQAPLHAAHPAQNHQPPPHLYHAAQFQTPSYYDPPPSLGIESGYRPTGQDPKEYIMPSLKVNTHPGLNITNPFSMTIPASPTKYHQSVTFTLPATHYYLQLIPHVPANPAIRTQKLFVTVNGTRQNEIMRPSIEKDAARPFYEFRLERGIVNKLEVELLQARAIQGEKGKEKAHWEKMTVFVHVMRG